MSRNLCKRSVAGWILAAMVAGGSALPAVAVQSAGTTAHKKAARKSVNTASSKTKGAMVTKKSSTAKGGALAGSATAGKTVSSKGVRGSKHSRKTKKVKGQAAPTPERISEIQEALARNGAYSGTSSGQWDDDTTEAMRKFQATHGLNPTGKMDAPTLQKLGFGSETAGMGAPTPPPNAVANRLLSPAAKREETKEEEAVPQ